MRGLIEVCRRVIEELTYIYIYGRDRYHDRGGQIYDGLVEQQEVSECPSHLRCGQNDHNGRSISYDADSSHYQV